MRDLEPLFLGRTFDDFLFRPQRSPVSTRRAVDLSMPLVAGLDLGLPIVGANMDTVVGEEMARALALEGAFGFLHRSCSIETQAARVRYVKTRHSYVIEKPLVLPRTATIADIDGSGADALRQRIDASGSLRDLWHLRSALYRIIGLAHAQAAARSRSDAGPGRGPGGWGRRGRAGGCGRGPPGAS